MGLWSRIKKWADGFMRDPEAVKEAYYYATGEQLINSTDEYIKEKGLRPMIQPLGVRNDN